MIQMNFRLKNKEFMKTHEYARLHGLNSEEDLKDHFLYNLRTGRLPVAMYSCPDCKEILWNFPYTKHKCINNKEST